MGNAAFALPSFDELYARIRALPQGVTGEILEPGVLRTMSRPAKAHRWAAKVLAGKVDRFDPRMGGTGWWIEVEIELKLPLGLLAVPDLCGFRAPRVPELPDENPLTLTPDWCCEILSPSTAHDDRRLKLPIYAASEVRWTWLVDPDRRMVEVFESVQGRPTLAVTGVEDERLALPPFDEDFDLAAWWMPRAAPGR